MHYANASEWMKTTNCFPNDQIIPLSYIAFLRLFQNLILVVCFTTIFILYAFICVRVTRRRQLKADRDQHYKELLDRSKRNTLAATSIIGPDVGTVSAHSTVQKFNELSQIELTSKNSISVINQRRLTTELSDPLLEKQTATNLSSDVRSFSSFQEINPKNQETCLILAHDTENNKSTQTVKSAICYIKK